MINKIKILAYLFFLVSINSFAQYKLSCKIENYSHREVKVFTQFGDESKFLGTVRTNVNSSFEYSFSNEEPGLYRVYLDNDEYFDIIYNNEAIQVLTNYQNPVFNMKVIKSNENSQLYAFLKEEFLYNYKIKILDQFIGIYPDEKFLVSIEKEKRNLVTKKNALLKQVIKLNPTSFAGKYLSYFTEIQAPVKYDEIKKLAFYRKEYLKSFDFTNLAMLNSNAYQKIVLNYLKLFKANNPDKYYIAGKDILDHIFFGEPLIFNTIFEYLLNGFETIGLSEQAAKLSYEFGDMCSDASDNLKSRIKSNTELGLGKLAPDFNVVSISGKTICLSKMKSDYTLVLFWATWCGHCQNTLPLFSKSKQLFDKANVNIIAISLDTENSELNKFLADNPFPWDVVCDYKSWGGKVVTDYAIYATPIMYLVDKNLKIIAKPFDEQKLFNEIEKLIANK